MLARDIAYMILAEESTIKQVFVRVFFGVNWLQQVVSYFVCNIC